MEEHLQLVGIVGLVACIILGIVVIVLCTVLCCQRCHHRDRERRRLVDSEGQTADDPPDYAWCAENAGYDHPDNMADGENTSQSSGNDEIPPPYDSVISDFNNSNSIILNPSQLPQTHNYSNKRNLNTQSSISPPVSWGSIYLNLFHELVQNVTRNIICIIYKWKHEHFGVDWWYTHTFCGVIISRMDYIVCFWYKFMLTLSMLMMWPLSGRVTTNWCSMQHWYQNRLWSTMHWSTHICCGLFIYYVAVRVPSLVYVWYLYGVWL